MTTKSVAKNINVVHSTRATMASSSALSYIEFKVKFLLDNFIIHCFSQKVQKWQILLSYMFSNALLEGLKA